MITVILPVSRTKYLDRVLESLKNQTYKADNLVVIHDGSDAEFVVVRNKIAELDFENKLCVKSYNDGPGANIHDRRKNIANIHNQFREIISDTSLEHWLFSIEDDGILPPDALERLLKVAKSQPYVGMVTGVELGRWGSPYVGAWRVDNKNNVTKIWSIQNKSRDTDEVEDIDACGLYCALIRANRYRSHHFFTNNGLGPDVNLGLSMRREGLRNYIDWGVHVTHLTSFSGLEVEISATDNAVKIAMTHIKDNVWQIGA